MEKIISLLDEAYKECLKKITELDIFLNKQDARKIDLDQAESDLNQKISAFGNREATVKRFENVERVESDNEKTRLRLIDEEQVIKNDREKFDKYRIEEENRLQLERQRIANEWKALKGEQ